MNEPLLSVWVVDDDPVARMVALEELDQPSYVVREFSSGEACMAALDGSGDEPDLVLLDVEMSPGMSGYEVCRRVRELGGSKLQVLFVSARDDLDSRLAGYDAGGDDFIVKPYSREELMKKVRASERAIAAQRELAQLVNHAQQAAFSAMSTMGEMGAVLQFIRASFSASTEAQLACAVFDAVGWYGLRASLQIRGAEGKQCFAPKGACSALEESILDHASGMDRIFHLGSRMVVNFPRVSLLLSDLPTTDPDKIGRLRDHLAIISEAADSRQLAIENERMRLRQLGTVVDAASTLVMTLDDVELRRKATRARTLAVTQRYLENLVTAFISMGLSEMQETVIIDLAQDTITEITAELESDQALAEQLRGVAESLSAITTEEARLAKA